MALFQQGQRQLALTLVDQLGEFANAPLLVEAVTGPQQGDGIRDSGAGIIDRQLLDAGRRQPGNQAGLCRTVFNGAAMARHARGIDRRPVVTEHVRKSVSQERTFRRDLVDERALKEKLWQLSQGVGHYLKRSEMTARTIAIKLRYADFSTLSRQATRTVPTDDETEIYRQALDLLARAWQPGRPVRLLGVAARGLVPAGDQATTPPAEQLSFWE